VLPQDAQFDAALMTPAASAGQLAGTGRRQRPASAVHSAVMGSRSALGARSPLVILDHGRTSTAAATRADVDVIPAPGPTLMAEDSRQPVLNVSRSTSVAALAAAMTSSSSS